MGWNYDAARLANNPMMQVRLLIQDTDASDPLLQDEEINFFLTVQGANVKRAAADACDAIALQLAKQETLDGDVKQDPQRSSKSYSDKAERLRREARLSGVIPFAGGISQSDKDARASDTDRVQTSLTHDLHDGVPPLDEPPFGCLR